MSSIDVVIDTNSDLAELLQLFSLMCLYLEACLVKGLLLETVVSLLESIQHNLS